MDCENCREAASARLDGEDPGLDPARVDEHLAGCAHCRDWLADTVRVTRAVRLQPVDDVPDVTAAVLTRVTAARGADGHGCWWLVARLALFAVAAAQWAAALGMVFDRAVSSPGNVFPTHGAHELGAFGLAVAVGFGWTAWRPARARAYLPLLGTLVGVLAAVTATDLAAGHTAPTAETGHLLLVAGLALTAILARYSEHGMPPADPTGRVPDDGTAPRFAPRGLRRAHPAGGQATGAWERREVA